MKLLRLILVLTSAFSVYLFGMVTVGLLDAIFSGTEGAYILGFFLVSFISSLIIYGHYVSMLIKDMIG